MRLDDVNKVSEMIVKMIGLENKGDRRAKADMRAQQWLAAYNKSIEKGNASRAMMCYRKAQFWLDRLNKLDGLR